MLLSLTYLKYAVRWSIPDKKAYLQIIRGDYAF